MRCSLTWKGESEKVGVHSLIISCQLDTIRGLVGRKSIALLNLFSSFGICVCQYFITNLKVTNMKEIQQGNLLVSRGIVVKTVNRTYWLLATESKFYEAQLSWTSTWTIFSFQSFQWKFHELSENILVVWSEHLFLQLTKQTTGWTKSRPPCFQNSE